MEVPSLPARPNQPAALSLAALAAAPPQPSDPAVLPPAPLPPPPRLQFRLPVDLLSRDPEPEESLLAHPALAPWLRPRVPQHLLRQLEPDDE
jgi:hypothetical protein